MARCGQSRNPDTRLALVAATLGLALAPAFAGDRPLTIVDYTGRGFAPDLVTYTLDGAAAARAAVLRVTGPEGQPLGLQVTPAGQDGTPATVSFVASVPANGRVTYTLKDAGASTAPATSLALKPAGDALELTTALLGVRLPTPTDKTFATPVAWSALPAPIQAFRSGDGWLGGSRIVSDRKVKRFRVQVTAKGPVFAEVQCRYDLENGGHYQAAIRVIEGVPLAKVTEEYDAGELGANDLWELDLGKGWSPDRLEVNRFDLGGFGTPKLMTLDELRRSRAAPGTPGFSGEVVLAGQPDLAILPSYYWKNNGTSYLGLLAGDAQQQNPTNSMRVGFVPLHKGAWRMTNPCEVFADGPAIRVQLPLCARYNTWPRDGASQTSPFSIGQHDPALPRTVGRRTWGLLLAPLAPGWRPTDGKATDLTLARIWYGIVGLDRYKDYVLDWPDAKTVYPRVFQTADDMARMRARLDQLPATERQALQSTWVYSHDATIAARELTAFYEAMEPKIKDFFSSVGIGHHDMWGQAQWWADDLLAWPDLPAADRRKVRALLALMAYNFTEPDVTSAGIGDHTGNPNMSTSRGMSAANFAALLPDHPMHAAWARYLSEFAEYKISEYMAPGGGWLEFSSYHQHGFYAFARGFMGHVASGAANQDRLFSYLREDMDYWMNLLTPLDSRFGIRMTPGGANGCPIALGYYGEWISAAALKDPSFAAELRWAWDQNGHAFVGQSFGGPIVGLDRPWIAPRDPQLASRNFPGVGLVFRAHPGPDETYLHLRSGFCWSHWGADQGHFTLLSKGATLVPYQPYQYYSPKNKTDNQYNTIRFGHPENTYAYSWPDSAIIDCAFGPTVDYAWASAGYPAWYVHPHRAPGFGDPLKLTEGLDQKEGEFYWHRQFMFLKGRTGQSPNYFVVRDTMPPLASSRLREDATARQTGPAGEGQLASWLTLNLPGRKGDVRQEGGHIALSTEWPVGLDFIFASDKPAPAELGEIDLPCGFGHIKPEATLAPPRGSRNWVDNKERIVSVRLAQAPGQEYFWLMYPRGPQEALPAATRLAPGVMKVVTGESTDYVFVSPSHLNYAGEEVVFSGGVGAVRLGKDGSVTLAMNGGSGKVGYKGRVLEGAAPFERTFKPGELKAGTDTMARATFTVSCAPQLNGHQAVAGAPGLRKAVAGETTEYLFDATEPGIVADGNLRIEGETAAVHASPAGVRIVVTRRAYARVTLGKVGVRGMGPFDLTFTPDAIRGTVEGHTRTLVVTRPRNIVKPMFHQDGLRYFAGYADDSARFDGRPEPQFGVAFGVTDGKHQVAVDEWTYPSLPPVPARLAAGSAVRE